MSCAGDDSLAPHKWGTIAWTIGDLDRRKAQFTLRVYDEFARHEGGIAAALHVSREVASLYLSKLETIPKGVGFKVPALIATMRKKPDLMHSLMNKVKDGYTVDRHDLEIVSNSEINTKAAEKVAIAVAEARMRRGESLTDAANAIGIPKARLAEIENLGATPRTGCFFDLLEHFSLPPEIFGFVGCLAGMISRYRREQRERL